MGRGTVEALMLILLVLWTTELTVEGCTCEMSHFQTRFCEAEVVFRAQILEQINVKPDQMIQYKIKLIETFRGFSKMADLQYIYTPLYDSLCGVQLGKMQYLLSGYLQRAGYVEVSLCDIAVPWSGIASYQIENLKYRYQNACECSISNCYEPPCLTSANTCVWTKMDMTGHTSPEQVCLRGAKGLCNWYVGGSVTGGVVGQSGGASPKITSGVENSGRTTVRQPSSKRKLLTQSKAKM